MVLFVTMVITFALSTIYWVLSVVVTFLVIRAWFSELDPATHSAPTWLPMLSAILLVNVSTKSFNSTITVRLDTFPDIFWLAYCHGWCCCLASLGHLF
jgi:hypothetical protein